MVERIIIPLIKKSRKTPVESFSVAKPMFYEEQEDVFKGSMAFAEASWRHSTEPWLWLPKAVAALGQSMCELPGFVNKKVLVFKEIPETLIYCLGIIVFSKVQ